MTGSRRALSEAGSGRLLFGGVRLVGAVLWLAGCWFFGFLLGLFQGGDDDVFTRSGAVIYLIATVVGVFGAIRLLSRRAVPVRLLATTALAGALVWRSGALELEPLDATADRGGWRRWVNGAGEEVLFADASPALMIATTQIAVAGLVGVVIGFTLLFAISTREATAFT